MDFAHAGYPLDAGALLIIEVGRLAPPRSMPKLAKIVAICQELRCQRRQGNRNRTMETAAIWKGRKSAFGATGRVADYICMDGNDPEPASLPPRCCTG